MHYMAVTGLALTMAVLVGCSSGGQFEQRSVIVDYYAGATDLSGYPGMGMGGGDFLEGQAGASRDSTYPILDVKRCNAEMTACSLGLMDLSSRITVLEVGPSAAKVQVALAYRVGREVRREAYSTSTVQTLPSDVDVLFDEGQETRSAEIPYGVVRGIDMPYGVAFALCVSPPDTLTKTSRPCAENLRVSDPGVVPAL